MTALGWQYADGGRAEAGYRGKTGDCGTRALALATGLPYQEVYDLVTHTNRATAKRGTVASSSDTARNGVTKRALRKLLADWGWVWTPTMHIGSGTTVHLRTDELPAGPLVVSCSRHVVYVRDGVVFDTHNPTRGGTRAVYGYWQPGPQAVQA